MGSTYSAPACFLSLTLLLASATAGAAPGDFDSTYGQLGRTLVRAADAGVLVQPNRFIQQTDGKTVIIGWTEAPTNSIQDFAVVRLDANGNLDSTFAGDGIVTIGFGTLDQGIGIVQQNDGKLVVAGVTNSGACPANPCMALARLDANGALDATFGGGTGKVVIANPLATTSVAIDVVMQGSNFVIGGHRGYNDFIFLRLNSAGVLDPTFNGGGNGGVAVIDMGDPMLMMRMIAQADGRFVATGAAAAAAPVQQKGIARVTSEGLPDTTLNGTGRIVESCATACQSPRVVQQPDGKLLFVGFDTEAGLATPTLLQARSYLERRHSNGTLDTSFGVGGRLINVFENLDRHPAAPGGALTGVAVDSATGNITVVGRMTSQGYSPTATALTSAIRVGAARFTPTGEVDTTFGSGGLRLLPLTVGPSVDDLGVVWYNADVMADGRTMLLGAASQAVNGTVVDKGMAIARLSNGASHAGTLSATGFPVPENAPFAWAVVSRTGGSTGTISVNYAAASGTAIAGSDFIATAGTLTWGDGDIRPKLVKVPLISDSVAESADESFDIVLSNATGGADIASVGTVTILRDDVPPTNTITVASMPTNVFESSGSVTFSVSRTGTDPISVNYSTSWDSATGNVASSPADYGHVNGILVWGTGDTSTKTITVPIVNDGVAESAEELNFALYVGGGGAVLSNSLMTVTIHNGSPPTISIASTASIGEGQPSSTVEVTRAGPTTATVAVNYTTSNGTATAGTDYTTAAGTLTWLPGDADVKTISIPLLADSVVEGNESFTVTLSNATGGATLGGTSSTVTITDDDSPPPPPPPPASGGGGGGGGGAITWMWLALLSGLLMGRRRLPPMHSNQWRANN